MGEFFKEEEKKKSNEEETFIENPQQLFGAYDVLRNKIQIMKDDSYEAIMPIRTELMGAEDSPESGGQIHDLRRRLQNSRISSMTIGNAIWNTLKNIEDLDRWSERYIDFTEGYFDSYNLIARSSFKIITNLNLKIDGLKKEVRELIQKIEMQRIEIQSYEQSRRTTKPKRDYNTTIPPVKINSNSSTEIETNMLSDENNYPQGNTNPEAQSYDYNPEPASLPPKIDIFEELFGKSLENYKRAKKSKDELLIDNAKKHLYAICGKNMEKIKRVAEEIAYADNMFLPEEKNG